MTGPRPRELLFYSTPDHECSYLPTRSARTAFVDPNASKSAALYSLLARHGFRRSGDHIYRPYCTDCRACVPVRVPAAHFRPARRHRRASARNRDLAVTVLPPRYRDEYFDLYQRYLTARHPGGGMDETSPEKFADFLLADWIESEFVEFRDAGKLVAVSVLDGVDDGLSAVYTFFEPAASGRGLGTYAILWSIDEVRRRALAYLYLGYLIEESPKMAYKADFRPQERLVDGLWTTV